jgi:hypothetical protein
MIYRIFCAALVLSLCGALSAARGEENSVEVLSCELAAHPKAYHGKMIRVRGTANVNFEDFTLALGNCASEQGIWLAFGGDVPGIVVSMANDNFRKPGKDIEIEGVSYGIRRDDNFHRFYALIAARHGEKADYRVTATLTGKFFSGEEIKTAKGVRYGGYGHLGCCALLLITEVSDVTSVPPANLSIRGAVVGPDRKPLAGVTIINDVLGGSPPERQTSVTDERGEFRFADAGQQLRVKDPRYRPVALTVQPGRERIRLVLQDARESDWIIPKCENDGASERAGFSARFVLPSSMRSTLEKYEGRESIFVYNQGEESASAELTISRNLDGTVEEANSLDSDSVEERWMKDGAGKVMGVDVRGRTLRGEEWREAIFNSGEVAGYWLRIGKEVDLDRIVDSACLR